MAVDVATEAKVEALRAQMPAVLATGYFNTGSNGPVPAVAHEAAAAIMREEFAQGRIVPGLYESNRDRNRALASLAATIFNAAPDEIALTRNASEGLAAVLMGITWHAGDEVVSTTEEHPGLLLPLAQLSHRYGVVTRYVDVGNDPESALGAITSQINSRTRMIALSHVLWSTGFVLPLREIVDLAREHELMVVVDGAQSAGQIPVDLHTLGVDAYGIPGQKWLCGPESTGLLYIRKERFADVEPTYVRYGTSDPGGYFMPAAGAMRYEIGGFYSPAVAALLASLQWLRDDVGLDWAYARIAALGAEFRHRLADTPGVTVVTPAKHMAGLVNFTVDGLACSDVAARVFERGYTIRFVEYPPCTVSARASIGWWNTEEEVVGLADAIADIASGARRERD